MSRFDTDGWRAVIHDAWLLDSVGVMIGRSAGENDLEVLSGIDEHGNARRTIQPAHTVTAPLLYLPEGAAVALADALHSRYPRADAAVIEELRSALKVERERVDRVLTQAGLA